MQDAVFVDTDASKLDSSVKNGHDGVMVPVEASASSAETSLSSSSSSSEKPVRGPQNHIRLHMLALPHTITSDDFSHCAFTGKVKRFAPMMRSLGYEVFHYGVEGSEADASVDIQVLQRSEWQALRIESLHGLRPGKSLDECRAMLEDETAFVGDLGNVGTVLYKVFNARLAMHLKMHYRSMKTDIICLPFGFAHGAALLGLDAVTVESGIGYPNSFSSYRIFESYSYLHHELGKTGKSPQNYWFVAPNYFDVTAWPLSLTPRVDTVGFLGRICTIKGCAEVVSTAARMPHIRFVICGQGDPTPFLTQPNVVYKAPVRGDERGVFLGSLVACMAPSRFAEPFCGVNVEAQLCGTPVITTHSGAVTETIEHGVTGLLCHTLHDYVHGVTMAVEGKFDRAYISKRAVRLYDMYNVAHKYDYAFKCINDVHNGRNGWLAVTSNIDSLKL